MDFHWQDQRAPVSTRVQCHARACQNLAATMVPASTLASMTVTSLS